MLLGLLHRLRHAERIHLHQLTLRKQVILLPSLHVFPDLDDWLAASLLTTASCVAPAAVPCGRTLLHEVETEESLLLVLPTELPLDLEEFDQADIVLIYQEKQIFPKTFALFYQEISGRIRIQFDDSQQKQKLSNFCRTFSKTLKF